MSDYATTQRTRHPAHRSRKVRSSRSAAGLSSSASATPAAIVIAAARWCATQARKMDALSLALREARPSASPPGERSLQHGFD